MRIVRSSRSKGLAVQAGFANANPYSRSLIERIRLSKGTQWRRLLIWGTFVVCLSFVAGLAAQHYVPGRTAHAALLAIVACTSFGACAYCFFDFVLGRKLYLLFFASAFSALCAGAILQAVVDFYGHTSTAHNWVELSARLFATLLFACGARTDARFHAANRFQSTVQIALAFVFAIAFPLAAAICVKNFNFLANPGSFAYSAAIAMAVLTFTPPVLIGYALLSCHRRYMHSSDGLYGLLCYFYVSFGIGVLFCLNRSDMWQITAQAAFGISWLALLVGNGIENASAHKEAADRLEELETLHDISWSLVGAATLKELLNLFVNTLVNKLGARIAAVYTDTGESSLELAAICGSDDAKPGTIYPLVGSGHYPGFQTGHTAKAFASREVQVANDVFVDVELVPWRIVAADDGCAVSLPLVDCDICVGVLSIYFSDSSQLTAIRLRMLATVAAAATSAIKYALSKQSDQLSSDSETKMVA